MTQVSQETVLRLVVDGAPIEARAGSTVLQACRAAGIHVPTLCDDPRLEPFGGCRLCIVEIEGMRGYPTSCTTPAAEGMVVTTRSDALFDLRRTVVELLLSDHKIECFGCESAGACGLQDVAYEHEVVATPFLGERHRVELEDDHPLIVRDLEKCISCGRCVRICGEVQGRDVYGHAGRGFDSLPLTPFGVPLLQNGCESCGQCVSTCPTGALSNRLSRFAGRVWEVGHVETTCGYCGVGCTLDLSVKQGRIIDAAAPLDRGVNGGNLCGKGRYGWSFTHSPERLTKPLLRRDGELVEVSWDEAVSAVAEGLRRVRDEHGPDAIGGVSSAKCTNEENYLFQKLMRAAIGTNNVDHCARLCHASTVAGLAASFGSGAMTNPIADVGAAEVVLVIGSNTAEAHPVIGIELKKAARRGTRLIVVDPRRVRLADHAERWVAIRPGTNTAFVNAVMSVILAEGLADEAFIAERTEGFDGLRAILEGYDLERAAETCGVTVEEIRQVALAYGSAERASIVYSMGVTQHTSGTDQVRAIANLAMLTGNVGRTGTGVNPLRGQNNVQGACDVGCLPEFLPGYQRVSDPAVLERFRERWGMEEGPPAGPGLTLVEMMDAAVDGGLKAMYVMGENPVLADPDQAHVIAAMEALDFLVVQDIFLTETAAFADVVLPAASFLEKDGTFTSTERRVQRVRRVVDPPGEALTDMRIVARVSAALGLPMEYPSASKVMAEIAEVMPQYAGITYERLEERGGLQWPCTDCEHPGTPVLHAEGFARGRGSFAAVDHVPSPERTDEDRPLILTTGRHLHNFHTNTMTSRSRGLADLSDHGYVEMHPGDAERLGVCDGDLVEVTSAHGSVVAEAHVGRENGPRAGVVFMPFHFAHAPANRLTGTAVDPDAKIPGFKVTAVRVVKAARHEREPAEEAV